MVLIGMVASLGSGCEEVIVETVAADSVAVQPSEATLSVDDVVQLSGHVYGPDGVELAGREIQWESEDEAVAVVDAEGRVIAQGTGTATIQAKSEGAVGEAVIRVRQPPLIIAEPGTAAFTTTAGAPEGPELEAAIRNGGEESLEGLQVRATYDGSEEGWLRLQLFGSRAPARLTLRVDVEGLAPGTYKATAIVEAPRATNSPFPIPVSLEVGEGPPTAPSGLTASVAGGPVVELTWVDNSGDETGFELQRADDGGSFATLAELGPDVVEFRDDEVVEDRTYRYRIRACSAGGCSAFSGEAAVTTRPVPPTGLSAALTSNTSVALSWEDASATETGFRIERRSGGQGYSLLTVAEAGSESYTDTGLQRGTTFEYRIAACNATGCSNYAGPAAVSTPPLVIPAAPTDLVLDSVSDSSIRIRWTDRSDNEEEFQIERKSPEGSFTVLDRVAADLVTYTDQAVTSDRRYVYRVRACGEEACSSYSNELTVDTPPTAPSGLAAAAAGTSAIQLTWVDRSLTETEFQLERKSGSSGFAAVASIGAGETGFLDEGLEPGTTYQYRLRACNDGGCSDYTATASATTDPARGTAPAAPSGLRAVEVDDDTVVLEWNDNSENETEFVIERRSHMLFEAVGTVAADVERFSDERVKEDRTYEYRVKACNADGCSDPSNIVRVTTDDD
ncbi:MAG: fibronectin type III domain-containing protein [Gemmatimonadota bacterium]